MTVVFREEEQQCRCIKISSASFLFPLLCKMYEIVDWERESQRQLRYESSINSFFILLLGDWYRATSRHWIILVSLASLLSQILSGPSQSTKLFSFLPASLLSCVSSGWSQGTESSLFQLALLSYQVLPFRAWEKLGIEGVLCIPQSSSTIWVSPSDCLVSYPRHLSGRSYPSAEVQLVYSTAP